MKRALKIIGIITLVFVVLLTLLVVKIVRTPMVPNDYTQTVATGGDIEAKYLAMGNYEVKYKEEKTTEVLKKYEVYYPEELEQSERKYPVVVFVNGTGVYGSKYKALFKHLSSWGFIVLGNEDPGTWSGESADKTLEYIINENSNKDSIFHNRVDLDNIGISGHSQGGVGVFNAITENNHSDPYKTAVALSPTHEEAAIKLNIPYDLTKIKIPTMLIAGTGNFETQMVIPLESMKTMYEKINAPKVMMRKTGHEHGDMLYAADGYVTAWFMWQLQDDEEASKAFIGDNAEIEGNELYQNQSLNIFEDYSYNLHEPANI